MQSSTQDSRSFFARSGSRRVDFLKFCIIIALSIQTVVLLWHHNTHTSYGTDNMLKWKGSIEVGAVNSASILKTKDIVIGMASNIDPMYFAVFCGSLRQYTTYSEVEIVVFARKEDCNNFRISEIAHRYSVRLISIDLELVSWDARYKSYHPSTQRWLLIFTFFGSAKIRQQYNHVLMIDVRDTYFQDNPFNTSNISLNGYTNSTDLPSYILAFEEFGNVPIAECEWNSGWIRDCFGSNTLREVENATIICSGVIFGTMDATYEYLTVMQNILIGVNDSESFIGANLSPDIASCERNGIDQGIHNVIVQKKLVPNLSVIGAGIPPYVIHMQSGGQQTSELTKLGIVATWKPFVIVHQYDRYSDLQSVLLRKYVYWFDTDNIAAAWSQNKQCTETYNYVADRDLLAGSCDLKSARTTLITNCCKLCSDLAGCTSFTFYKSSCYFKSCSQYSDFNRSKILLDSITAYIGPLFLK